MLYEELEEELLSELSFLRPELDKKLKLLDNPEHSQQSQNQLELIELNKKTEKIIKEINSLKNQISILHSKLRLFHDLEEDDGLPNFDKSNDRSSDIRIEKMTQMTNTFKLQKDQALKIIVNILGKEKLISLKDKDPSRDILDLLLEDVSSSAASPSRGSSSRSHPSSPYRSL